MFLKQPFEPLYLSLLNPSSEYIKSDDTNCIQGLCD